MGLFYAIYPPLTISKGELIMCVMTETLVVIANSLKPKELPSIIADMTEEEQAEFTNALCSLNVVKDFIAAKQSGCING